MKALVDTCADVAQFPPGHYFDSASGELVRYYQQPWRDYADVQGRQADLAELRQAFEHAVERQLMSDVPYGVLLSGGLDSSLVAAVAARYARRRIEDGGQTEAWWPRLHSFAIGLKGSPDLAAAAIAAEALGTVHHGFEYTFEEGLDALPEVIRHIETYDVTTIRASTPMFLLARRIKAMGVKMVLSGEGSDEIFGGYLYFHKAPDAREFHEELVRKLDALHNYDCLRANKSMMAWGWSHACRSWIVNSSTWRCASMLRTRWSVPASVAVASRRRCCAGHSTATCRTASCGVRRSSSAMASAMDGSTA